MFIQLIISICFLIVLSFIDIFTYSKHKSYIPSMITTAFLIVSFIIFGNTAIYTGALGFLIALFLTDVNLFLGLADIKVFTACCMAFPTFMSILWFSLIMLGLTVIYQFIVKKFIKNQEVIPLIPLIFIAFLGGIFIL